MNSKSFENRDFQTSPEMDFVQDGIHIVAHDAKVGLVGRFMVPSVHFFALKNSCFLQPVDELAGGPVREVAHGMNLVSLDTEEKTHNDLPSQQAEQGKDPANHQGRKKRSIDPIPIGTLEQLMRLLVVNQVWLYHKLPKDFPLRVAICIFPPMDDSRDEVSSHPQQKNLEHVPAPFQKP